MASPALGFYGDGSGSGIVRTADGGAHWAPVDLQNQCIAAGDSVSAIWFVTPTSGWAVSDASADSSCPTLLRTTDSGLTWTPLRSPFAPERLSPSEIIGLGGGFSGGDCSFSASVAASASDVLIAVRLAARNGVDPSTCGGTVSFGTSPISGMAVRGTPLQLAATGSYSISWSNWCADSAPKYLVFAGNEYPGKPSGFLVNPPRCVDNAKPSVASMTGQS